MGKPFYQSLLPAIALLATLAGCGGGGGGSKGPSTTVRTGELRYAVEWPDRTRAMPRAANSVVVTVSYKGQIVGSKTLNRPLSPAAASDAALFEGLPAGEVVVAVAAFLNPDGQGAELAKGVETLTLAPGRRIEERASLASTAATLTIDPATLTVEKDETRSVALTAKDERGHLVPLQTNLDGEHVEWISDDPNVVVVEGTATGASLKGMGAGTAHVGARFVVNDGGRTIGASTTVAVAARAATGSSPTSGNSSGGSSTGGSSAGGAANGGNAPVGAAIVQAIDISGARTATTGGERSLVAVATYGDGSTANVTAHATWTTDGGAAVSASGVFRADRTGRYTVTATLGGLSQSVVVDVVSARTVVSIDVSPGRLWGTTLDDVPLKATATYDDGTKADVTTSVTWDLYPAYGVEASVSPSGLFRWDSVEDPTYGNCMVVASLDGVASNYAMFWFSVL